MTIEITRELLRELAGVASLAIWLIVGVWKLRGQWERVKKWWTGA